jgi:succinyl-diaminopimelate desuccinylase
MSSIGAISLGRNSGWLTVTLVWMFLGIISTSGCAAQAPLGDGVRVRSPGDLVDEGRLVRMTQEMVRINTEFAKGIVHNHQEIVDYLAGQLSALGIEHEVIYPEEPFEAPYHRGLNVPYPGEPSDFPVVVARIRGTRGTPVLGLSQLYNSVVIGDRSQWTVDPLGGEIIDGRIYGRGATNSHASIAMYIEAMRVLKESGVRLEGDLVVAMTPGEGATEFGLPWAVENRPDLLAADWYLMGCCGPRFTKHGGHIWAKLTVHGAMDHPISGANPNAVHQMAKIIHAVVDVERWMTWEPEPLFGNREPYVEVTNVSSGDSRYVAVNVMPSKVEALLDIRLYPNQESATVVAQLRGLLDDLMAADSELAVDLEITGVQKPPAHVWDRITEDDPLVQVILDLTREITGNPDVGMQWSGGFAGGRPDLWNTGAKVIYSGGLPGQGGGGGGAHAPDEWVAIDGLVPRTQRIVDVVQRALGTSR